MDSSDKMNFQAESKQPTSKSNSSPWGNPQQSNSVSFAEIMSEDLAKELEIQETKKYVESVHDKVSDPDLQFSTSNGDCDSDHLIAQMLQLQYDKEHDEAIKKVEEKNNRSSKVSVSLSNYRIIPECLLSDSDSDSDYEDIEDKHKEWDSFVGPEKAFKSIPKSGYKKEGDDVVTKHDISISNRRNARKVMEFPPGLHTGDGGGFEMQLTNKVYNSLKVYSRNEHKRRARIHDKSEQATSQQGVDPKTRLLLYKLINQGILDKIYGTVSTGKESIVLYADGGEGVDASMQIPKEVAIKVFKTTLNEFKTRDKYIEDDFRFKDRFSKQNPRKIIHLWAEKEMHNLRRLKNVGILCPDVVILKKHVLVMSFIGENGKSATKLKDACLNVVNLTIAYEQVLDCVKKMYNEAKLVHADLSEYNILWHNDSCWFIDLSQAVETKHPQAFEFLYRDCTNMSNFFTKSGLPNVMKSEEMFKTVTGLDIPEDGIEKLQESWNLPGI